MKIMYPRQVNHFLAYIVIFVLFIAMFFVFHIKEKPAYMYLMYSLIIVTPWINFFYYRFRPFALIRDGLLILDRGIFSRRLKVVIDDIFKIDKYVLNSELRGFEIFLKSGESLVYVFPLSENRNEFLENSIIRIKMEMVKSDQKSVI